MAFAFFELQVHSTNCLARMNRFVIAPPLRTGQGTTLKILQLLRSRMLLPSSLRPGYYREQEVRSVRFVYGERKGLFGYRHSWLGLVLRRAPGEAVMKTEKANPAHFAMRRNRERRIICAALPA